MTGGSLVTGSGQLMAAEVDASACQSHRPEGAAQPIKSDW
jgi:hypothetical protein